MSKVNRGLSWARRLVSSLLLVVLMFSFLSVNSAFMQSAAGGAVAETEDWPMFRYDLQRNGYSTTSTAPIINQPLWSYTTGDEVTSSPAVVDGRVYVGSDDDNVYCLDAASGELVWSYLTGGDVDCSPAVADGKVYVGSADNKLYCLDAANGMLVWSYMAGGDVFSSPAVVDGMVYFGSDDNKVYCLNAANGGLVWSYTTGDDVWSSPAVVGGRVYVGSVDSKVYCLNVASGALIWSFTTGDMVESSPAVVDGKVYVGSFDDKVYCLNAVTGAFIWSYTTGGNVESSPAVADGKVYVGSNDNKVHCLNAASGALVWSFTTGDDVVSSPAVADGMVFVGSFDNKTYCLNAITGAFLWSHTTGDWVESSPAVADGKVYVGSYDNNIYCLDAATGALIWSYTTGGNVDASPAVVDGVMYVGSWDNTLYAFGLPNICYFNSLFSLNNARMIYPSDATPKPLDCVAAMVSDWTASAFIYTKLTATVEGIDTDSAFVNQVTGKPAGAAGTGIISFGGPVVNPIVKRAENGATPLGDRAPIKFYANAGTFYFQLYDGTSIPGANLPASVINNNQDMFVIESYRDLDGRYNLLCYGFGWKGTYAAGKVFETDIYPNLAYFPYSWMIIMWDDTNANGFVNTIADGDTYLIVATG